MRCPDCGQLEYWAEHELLDHGWCRASSTPCPLCAEREDTSGQSGQSGETHLGEDGDREHPLAVRWNAAQFRYEIPNDPDWLVLGLHVPTGRLIWADGEAADLADFEAIRFLLRDALFIVPVSVEGTPAEAWCISQTYLATKTGRHGDRREPFLGLFRLAMEYLGVDVHYGQSGRSGWQDM